jgi:hypothetical protein
LCANSSADHAKRSRSRRSWSAFGTHGTPEVSRQSLAKVNYLALPQTAASYRETPAAIDEIQSMRIVDPTSRSYHFADERSLVAGVLRRDPAAWTELVRRYQPSVRDAIRRRLVGRVDEAGAAAAVRAIVPQVYRGLVDDDMARLRACAAAAGLVGDQLAAWAAEVTSAWVRSTVIARTGRSMPSA